MLLSKVTYIGDKRDGCMAVNAALHSSGGIRRKKNKFFCYKSQVSCTISDLSGQSSGCSEQVAEDPQPVLLQQVLADFKIKAEGLKLEQSITFSHSADAFIKSDLLTERR